VKHNEGCATVHEVHCSLVTALTQFCAQVSPVGFVIDIVAVGQVFVLSFF
jgi:hypothetical protein